MRLRSRVLSVVATVAVAVGVSVVPAGTPVAAAPPGPAVGSQFHGMWSDYTDAERGQVLDSLKAHGISWVRIDVSWAMLQPDGPSSFSTWGVGFVDRVIGMAHDRGLQPLVTLWMTPRWANGGKGERALPDDPAHYAQVAEWAARRWAGKVRAWEVWNEPNSGSFMVGAEPAAYARLLRAAYPAFKAGDPTAPVVFGGTMYNDVDWIRRAYAAGAKGSFDVMATHPYMGASAQGPDADDGTKWSFRHARAVRDLMVAHGDADKPLWFTEMGWSTHTDRPDEPVWSRGVTLAQQAEYTVRSLQLIEQEMPYVTNVFWYNERDKAVSSVHDENFGLHFRDLRPKPVLAAVRDHLQTRVPTSATQVRFIACPGDVDHTADVVLCSPVGVSR